LSFGVGIGKIGLSLLIVVSIGMSIGLIAAEYVDKKAEKKKESYNTLS
jgi:hypothetical protein